MRLLFIIASIMFIGMTFQIIPEIMNTPELQIQAVQEQNTHQSVQEVANNIQSSFFDIIPFMFGFCVFFYIIYFFFTGINLVHKEEEKQRKKNKAKPVKNETKSYDKNQYKKFVESLNQKTENLKEKLDKSFENNLEKETKTLLKSSEYEKLTILLNALRGKISNMDETIKPTGNKMISQLEEMKEIIAKKPSYIKNVNHFFNGQDQSIYKMINIYSYLIHKKDLTKEQQEKLEDAKSTIHKFPDILSSYINKLRDMEFMELEVTNNSIKILDIN